MKNKFKYKNVLVVGLKKSGEASVNQLVRHGAFCYVYDDNKQLLKNFGANGDVTVASKIDENLLKIMDYMVISPAVSIYSECVKLAKLFGVRVISELELGSYYAKGSIVGITGTNGKTTTSSLLFQVLKSAQKPCVLCGNIGEPLCENILPFKTNYVVEMSSFQLESAVKLAPKYAVITNITPNHLDRHLNFKNYRDAKFNIFANMKRSGVLVLNYDDKTLRALSNRKIKPKIVWVSAEKEIEGYFLKGTKVFKKHKKSCEMLFDLKGIKLLGKHNLLNSLFVIAVCREMGLKDKTIKNAILSFEPISHRVQFVKNVNGVDYINDSKSTTEQSTITAINSLKNSPLILILGGSDKGVSYDKLAEKIKKSSDIKLVVVQGQTTKKMVKSLKKFGVKNYVVAQDFATALKLATQNATSGDVVLLSPACASFDQFECFEQRGEKFIEYVNSL